MNSSSRRIRCPRCGHFQSEVGGALEGRVIVYECEECDHVFEVNVPGKNREDRRQRRGRDDDGWQ